MITLPDDTSERERAMFVPAHPEPDLWLPAAIILTPGAIGLAVALILLMTE